MLPEDVTASPRAPGSVGEWEDLLVRLEIAPRVARNAVEEIDDGEAAAAALRAAVAREAVVGRWLEQASGIDDGSRGVAERGGGADSPDELSLRFGSLRARTFAMVQRRGLEVWEWEGPWPEDPPHGKPVTAHQLLLWLARRDAELLASLRQAAPAGPATC